MVFLMPLIEDDRIEQMYLSHKLIRGKMNIYTQEHQINFRIFKYWAGYYHMFGVEKVVMTSG